jgi:hypothetical protein
MPQFQSQARWNAFILCYMAWELALKQKEWNAKPFRHAPLAHSSLPLPIVCVPRKKFNYHFKKSHYQTSPHMRKLLSTTYSIVYCANHLFYTNFFIFTDKCIPFHLYYQNITLLRSHRNLFLHLSHTPLLTC